MLSTMFPWSLSWWVDKRPFGPRDYPPRHQLLYTMSHRLS